MRASARDPVTTREDVERNQRFIGLWNDALVPLPKIATLLGYVSADKVRQRAGTLRRSGYALIRRQRPSRRTGRASTALQRAVASRTDLSYYDVPPAIVMDAQGRPIALLDARTRERRPVGRA